MQRYIYKGQYQLGSGMKQPVSIPTFSGSLWQPG